MRDRAYFGLSYEKQETQLPLTNRATRLEVIKVIKHGTITYVRYGFLLVRYSNFVRKTHHFFRYSTSKCRDLENLENRVRDP